MADPADPTIDDFDCGEAEINSFFVSLACYDYNKDKIFPSTYCFKDSDSEMLVGLCAMAFIN